MDKLGKPVIVDVTDDPLAEKYARTITVSLTNRNWEQAYALIESYKREIQSLRTKPLTRFEWLQEPIANVPGIPYRLVNLLEAEFGTIFVEQFLRLVPNTRVLSAANNIGPAAVEALTTAFAQIGIVWPVVSPGRSGSRPGSLTNNPPRP